MPTNLESDRNLFIKGGHQANMSECMVYGMSKGCDDGCPVLNRGECGIPGENWDLILSAEVEHLYENEKEIETNKPLTQPPTNMSQVKQSINISQADFLDKLRMIDGAQEITMEFVAVTSPKMRKTHRDDKSITNPYTDLIRVTTRTGKLNGRYQQRVNEQRLKEGKAADFVASEMKWGEKENDGGCIINHANGPKIQLVDVETKTSFYMSEGRVINPDQLEPFFYSRSKPKSQDTHKEVVVRAFNVSSIQEMKIGATTYYID